MQVRAWLGAVVLVVTAACDSSVSGRRFGADTNDDEAASGTVPTLSLQHPTFVFDEGAPRDAITIVSDRPVPEDVRIALAFSGTFEAADFVALPDSILLSAGATQASVDVTLATDDEAAMFKSVVATLTAPSTVHLTRTSYTFELRDDDGVQIYFDTFWGGASPVDVHTAEGSPRPARRRITYTTGTISDPPIDELPLTIVPGGPPREPGNDRGGGGGGVDFDIVLELTDVVGTLSREDIVEDVSRIVLPAGQTEATWTATAVQDALGEGVEYAQLFYRVANAKAAGTRNPDGIFEVALRVFDDDVVSLQLRRDGANSFVESATGGSQLTIERFGDPSQALDVPLTYSGSAERLEDFDAPELVTIAPGETTVTFDVSIIDDGRLEALEDFTVRIAESPTYACFCSEGEIFTIFENDFYPEGRSIEITGTAGPGRVTLDWSGDLDDAKFYVYRRLLGATTWGAVGATVPANTFTFVDTDVTVGVTYEYNVRRGTGQGFAVVAYQKPVQHYRGRALVIAESGVAAQLTSEIDDWKDQLVGEGWDVLYETVAITDTPTSVKQKIRAHYDAGGLGAMILFGHVPVPYSGATSPDGHPDHFGAWPADAYYGDIDGVWTDTSINTVTASRPQNRNVPGDGKFDQSTLPSVVEVAVGRIDMVDLPAFAPATEVDLLRRYLAKLASYRRAVFTPTRRALIDDNFGDMSGEAFARAAWNWFGNIVSRGNISTTDWFTTLASNDYLWAYGCGGGSFVGAGGIGESTDFAHTTVNAVFTSLFGSYFGDFDATNAFMRAALASEGRVLTTAWSGRPTWTFHATAAGEPFVTSIGSTLNNRTYFTTGYDGGTHLAFLGDPTLHDYVHPPVTALTTSNAGGTVTVTWQGDTAANGYYVYTSDNRHSGYTLIGESTAARAEIAASQVKRYVMVRASRNQSTFGGSFVSLSVGAIADTE